MSSTVWVVRCYYYLLNNVNKVEFLQEKPYKSYLIITSEQCRWSCVKPVYLLFRFGHLNTEFSHSILYTSNIPTVFLYKPLTRG
jgi:hypothetical protein